MICKPGDVVIVPFPFLDQVRTKRRPAVVLSSRVFNGCGHTICAMITSANRSMWPGDVLIDHDSVGLPGPCVVRLKLFTLDNRAIQERKGSLASLDLSRVKAEVDRLLPFGLA